MQTAGTQDKPLIVLAGPTASGKSALALELAEILGGVIINADSMQVYRDLPVLTAQPGADEQARIPHRLYGHIDGAVRHTVAEWRVSALQEIDSAYKNGRQPLLVGGTGLYLKALLDGISPVPPIPEPVRSEIYQQLQNDGIRSLYEKLERLDPVIAATLKPTDTQRILRALEVVQVTGYSLSHWNAQPGEAFPGRVLKIVLHPERSRLYNLINIRFVSFPEQIIVSEAKRLFHRGLDPGLPVMKAVGYPQLLDYVQGKTDFPTAVALAQQATRNYAKRQYTWFRHQLTADVAVTDPWQPGLAARLARLADEFAENRLVRPLVL